MEQPAVPRRRPWYRRPSRLLPALSVLIILGVAAATLACRPQRQMIFGTTIGVGGVRLSLEEARSRLKFPVPALPAVSYPEACGGETSGFELLGLGSNGKQATLAYSHGIWIWVTPYGLNEPVGESEDRTTRTGTIRGQQATIVERGLNGRYFFCRRRFNCGGFETDPGTGARHWSTGAWLTWIENGIRIRLEGPYKAEELARIAELLSFS